MAEPTGRRIRVVIANHNHNRAAHALGGAFRDLSKAHDATEVCVIDSGSALAPDEHAWFQLRLPNVYYAGLWNAAVSACAELDDDDILLFVCSDVRVDDVAHLHARIQEAFASSRLGVYAPSAQGSTFAAMRNHGRAGLRRVPFVEGFCFAARLSLLRAMSPVDTVVNALGWGLDVQLCQRAHARRLNVVVDDAVLVHHAAGSGYSHAHARAQMAAWLAPQPLRVRSGHALLLDPFAQSVLGRALIRVVPWTWLAPASLGS